MSEDWKRNLPLKVRMRIALRDGWLRYVTNPIQLYRRRHGLADRDVFGQIKIQTNYTCTRQCRFCHYGQESKPTPQVMPTEVFKSIIDSLARIDYAGSVGIFEINEPFSEKRIVEFHVLARKKLPKCWLYLASNGDLIKKGIVEELFENGLNILYLNSYDEKAVPRNLEFINSLKPEHQAMTHHMNRTYQDDWESRAGNIGQYFKGFTNNPCDIVYNLCYIKPSGTVHPCVNDFHDKVILGNVNDIDLMEIWHGQKMSQLRQHLNEGNRNCNNLCSQCDYPGYRSLPSVPMKWRIKRLFRQ
nr:SPASM domain-containing protein [uncultured Pseudodesulfovibrio sp.]